MPNQKSVEHHKEEDDCLLTNYFAAAKGIHQASLEFYYTCQLPKVCKFGGIHAKTSSDRQVQTTIAVNREVLLSTEDFSKLLKVCVYHFVLPSFYKIY